MRVLGLIILTPLIVASAAQPDDGLAKKLLPIYVKEAESYSIAVESAPGKELELKKEPIFEWLNPARDGGQHGLIFVWLREGRPSALACIFSHPFNKVPGRKVLHELHALAPEKLIVKRDALNQWKPEAGLARKELPNSPAPATTSAARMLQIKKLAGEFTGYEVDRDNKRWELRLLPTALYRYPAAKDGVVDGALFAMVSNIGTDPEVLLLIEARAVEGALRWEYACGRFSDLELHVQRQDKEVWSSVPSELNPPAHDPLHLYRLYPEKVVSLEGKLLARFRQTPQQWWGILEPVEDK